MTRPREKAPPRNISKKKMLGDRKIPKSKPVQHHVSGTSAQGKAILRSRAREKAAQRTARTGKI